MWEQIKKENKYLGEILMETMDETEKYEKIKTKLTKD